MTGLVPVIYRSGTTAILDRHYLNIETVAKAEDEGGAQIVTIRVDQILADQRYDDASRGGNLGDGVCGREARDFCRVECSKFNLGIFNRVEDLIPEVCLNQSIENEKWLTVVLATRVRVRPS